MIFKSTIFLIGLVGVVHSTLEFDFSLRDLKSKKSLCSGGKCNVIYGQVVEVFISLKFTGVDWSNPSFSLLDSSHLFLPIGQTTQVYNVCMNTNKLVTSLTGCNLPLKAGTHSFSFTATVEQAPKDGSKSNVRLLMQMNDSGKWGLDLAQIEVTASK